MKFDAEQLQAVNTEAARTLVVSVPGSGKTTVLVGRILRMIERGVRPEDITAITFTRYAAEEIKKRLGASARGVWIGTLHALALRIVRASGAVGGYAEEWLSVISDDEAEADLHLALRDVGLISMRKGKVVWSEVTASAWEEFVGKVCSGALVEEKDEDRGHVAMWQAWNLYLGRLRSQNTLTFGTMLIEAMRVLQDRSTLLFWRKAVRHVLVDEAQDTSNIQWSIVWRLVEKTDPDSLFVVGDEDQCQPGGTSVVLADGSSKRIADLLPGVDRLMSFDRHGSHIYGRKDHGFSFRKEVRIYTGSMVRVACEGRVSECTPQHKWPVRMRNPGRPVFCTYLMKQGERFRVGWCQLFGKFSQLHFPIRCRLEKADCGWILAIHDSKVDAYVHEQVVSSRYGIPMVPFEPHGNMLTQRASIDSFWREFKVDNLDARSRLCLVNHDRMMEHPWWEAGTWSKNGFRTSRDIQACNLLEGLSFIPVVRSCGRGVDWQPVASVERFKVERLPVYSLDVDRYHTYLCDGGLVTCNSLYGWRGAVPDELVKMAASGFHVVKLARCYRFGPGICDPASRLIAHNSNRIEKAMIPCGATPGVLEVVRDATVADVVAEVRKSAGLASGAAGVAVLARTHAVLEDVEEGLQAAGVPVHRAGNLSSLRKTAEFRALLCYLRLSVNPFDRRSFSGICATEGISADGLLGLREQALATGRSLVDCAGLDLSGVTRDGGFMWLGEYVAKRDQFRNYTDATRYLVGTAFLNGLATARDVLDWVAMADVQDDLRSATPNAVTLATIHAAKGLEWPVVLLVGANDGILPSLRKGSDEEEERRLAYVAITRARDRAVLMHVASEMFPDVSRFVDEANATGQLRAKQEDKR